MNCYTIFKRTASHADVLAAVGMADVLRHLDPRIVDLGDRFEVRLRRHLLPSHLEAVDPGFSWLVRPGDEGPTLPPERIVQTRAAASGRGAEVPCVTVAENRMYSILGRMKASGGPNRIIQRFAAMKREEWEARVWEGLHGRPDFVASSPLVQLFNPHAPKGYAFLKPSGTNRRDKTKDSWAEPFVEWLRFRGYFEGSAGWFSSGDLRVYCPVPGDIPYGQFAATAAAFRDLRLGGTAAKMDCRAVLGLTRLLIERAETYRRPRRSVGSVWITHYKDMGQAHTLMAMERLALPDWFELRTSDQAQLWLQTLEEHDVILRRLTDSHSDEFALLKQYRKTLQSQRRESIAEFTEFLADYGMLVFKKRSQDHWLLPQFTVRGVTPILSGDPVLRTVIQHPGFVAVASAIRGATVGAQASRRHGKFDHREIRYGLLSEIRRAGLRGSGELLATVSSFVSSFNREATRRHTTGLRAALIRQEEIEAFARLLARLPPELNAGSLLCGIASCFRAHEAVVQVEPEIARAMSA